MSLPRSQADNRFDIPEGRGRDICRGLPLFAADSGPVEAPENVPAFVCPASNPLVAYLFRLGALVATCPDTRVLDFFLVCCEVMRATVDPLPGRGPAVSDPVC